MPISSAKTIHRALKKGQLTVNKIKSYQPIGNNILISSQIGSQSYKTVIDGTGGHDDISKTNDPFLKSLLDLELVIPNNLGGIVVDSHTFQARKNHSCNTPIFTLGQIAKGDLFSTNALWFNRECASKVAENILYCNLTSKAS